MVRYGLGILAAAGACSLIGAAACSDDIQPANPTGGAGGAATSAGGGANPSAGGGPAAGGGTAVGGDKCTGACCPTEAKCYSDPALGPNSPGAECLATHDNAKDPEHLMMRQNWIYASTPVGNASPIVYGILATRSEFPAWDACNMSGGSSGYMQIQELFMPGGDSNIDAHYGYVGNAKFFTNADIASTLSDGLCFISEDWVPEKAADHDYQIHALNQDEVGDGNYGTPYPPGLPAPMFLKQADGSIKGWHAGPTKGKRLATDFDVSDPDKRKALLARFATGGDLATGGFQGVVFYDKASGYVHQFSPLTYTTVYDNATSHITIPIREAEVKTHFNNPAAPNCVGVYRTDKLQPGGTPNCDDLQDPQNPSWGCKNGQCAGGADGPATTDGYFLVTEIEQIYAAALGATLCVTYPTQAEVDKQGFYNATDKNCKTAKWDAKKADGSGIPNGDWCSATNSKATATCHDAFRSHSVHVFSGAKVKDPTQTCAP